MATNVHPRRRPVMPKPIKTEKDSEPSLSPQQEQEGISPQQEHEEEMMDPGIENDQTMTRVSFI